MEQAANEVLGEFHGSDEFPVEWAEGERELLWIYDDLHIPNPVSPMFFDIGGWWLTCDYMFRRFGTPFACDWIAKQVNGYVYWAAIPCDPDVHVEATELQRRYVPRVPREAGYAERTSAYLDWVLPHYAEHFLDWWRQRLRPEIERDFERLDGYDYDGASLLDLGILFEDALDVHDRHWKIHWLLNFAQFASSQALAETIAQVRDETDPELIRRLGISLDDRNWDSIRDLWEIKERVKADPELVAAFEGESGLAILSELERTDSGRRLIAERLDPHRRTYGFKSIWSHEFMFPTWCENPAPILEAIKGYLATDYDYPANHAEVSRDLADAKDAVMEGVEGEGRERLQRALDLALGMNPLTPDHHFYVDQGTNARLRIVLVAIGRRLAEAGTLDDPEDVMFLRYDELREVMADASLHDAKQLVSERRDAHEDAFELRPPSWIGTATKAALEFPYLSNWGFPDKFYAGEPAVSGELRGLPASGGIVEGTARFVSSPQEFDQVSEGEVLVCRMTNPAWVVVFTKIAGVVTESGGATSHPAVVAREFGIPAVVGASNAGQRIETGDRLRVNGTSGIVEIIEQ